MAFLDWRAEYSVGVPEIDEQHRRLIGIINHLHDVMKQGSRLSELMAVINELADYARHHFAHEERMLERVGYPELEEHKRKHEAMVAKVEEFRQALDSGRVRASLPLMGFLKDWLARHIMDTDRRYAAHLTASFKV